MNQGHKVETGMMLAKHSDKPEDDRVFLRSIEPGRWWNLFRERVVTLILTTGQARTLAAGLQDAVRRLEIKRDNRRRIITLEGGNNG